MTLGLRLQIVLAGVSIGYPRKSMIPRVIRRGSPEAEV